MSFLCFVLVDCADMHQGHSYFDMGVTARAIDGRASLAVSFNTRSRGVPLMSRSSNEVSSTDVHQQATSVHNCCISTSHARLTKRSWFQSPSQATPSARKASSPSHTAPFSSSNTVCLATFIRHFIFRAMRAHFTNE